MVPNEVFEHFALRVTFNYVLPLHTVSISWKKNPTFLPICIPAILDFFKKHNKGRVHQLHLRMKIISFEQRGKITIYREGIFSNGMFFHHYPHPLAHRLYVLLKIKGTHRPHLFIYLMYIPPHESKALLRGV